MRTAHLTVAATVLFAVGSPAMAQTNFSGAGEHTELNCDGGTVTIQGADNHIQIRGACTGLSIEGAANEVTIDLAPRASIRVQGASNRVAWRAPATAKPRLSISGADNRVYRTK